jgi:predicted Rossmann fold flavoprotein
MASKKRRIVVVGGGAAGILAAWRAASLRAEVVLLEKTVRLGTKILISGGGKCNITHDGPIEDLLAAFRKNEARFLRPACYRFTNSRIIEMLTSRGLRVYTRPDGRIFPVDATAKDVVAILRGYLDDANVEVRLKTPAQGLILEDGEVKGVSVPGGVEFGDRVIVSVGGSSYPNSGTTGDGWAWVKRAGHTIVPVRAALAPIDLKMPFDSPAGVAVRDRILKARKGGKEIARRRGDVLFTHRGISGPATLEISREVAEVGGDITIEIDLLPDCSPEELNSQLVDYCREHPKRALLRFCERIEIPESLLSIIGMGAGGAAARVDKKTRNQFASTLKGWVIGKVSRVPLDKGEVVSGGVALDEVDPHTMLSKRAAHLYLCGEMLDIAGPVGGYNLQAAFSTGYVAGESAASP